MNSSLDTHPETLPASAYTDPEQFERECDAIFLKHWWLVAPEALLAEPNSVIGARIARWPLVLARAADGRLRGFHNVCRHRAGPLVNEGECLRAQSGLVCRYHGWRYAMDGQLQHAAGLKPGSDLDYSENSLYEIRVASWNGMVFACLDPEAIDLVEWLGDIVDIAERFPAVDSLAYDGQLQRRGRANWKSYGDNSCEGYHVRMVHKVLGKTVAPDETEIRGYQRGQFVGFDVGYRSSEIDPSRRGRGFWVYKFPGLLLHFAEYAFNAESVCPRALDRIETTRYFWSDHATVQNLPFSAQDLIDSSAQVMDEDMAICERVQSNLGSGVYTRGRLSAHDEPGTIFFQQLVRDALATS